MATGSPNNYFVHSLLRARDWQHRPQLEQVCDWWRGRGVGFQPADGEDRKLEAYATRGRGVCALVGMGGAGKTAIADRFLNELLDEHRRPEPGREYLPEQRKRYQAVPTHSDRENPEAATEVPAEPAFARSGLRPLDDTNPTRQRVSPPHSVFVYSFYDDDKPESFFRHLQIWLEGTSAPDKQKSPTQLMFDIQQHRGQIILDGLEKVQESGARGVKGDWLRASNSLEPDGNVSRTVPVPFYGSPFYGSFGKLTSPSLRDLLNHIACGSARGLSVLVTSRFPLTDLRDSQPRFFHTIAVDQIDVSAGIALLRSRGTEVHGHPHYLAKSDT